MRRRYQVMADRMRRTIDGTDRHVHTETAVVQIDLLDNGVRLGLQAVPPGASTPVGPPRFERFDYVVFAIPPSVWSAVTVTAGGSFADRERVTGQKPVDLGKEIGLMAAWPAIKFFTVAEDRFWLKEQPPAAPYGGSVKLGQVWEGTDNQTRGANWVLSVFAGPLLPDSSKSPPFRARRTRPSASPGCGACTKTIR